MYKPTKMIASALVGGSVLLTAACGGSSRPSVSDIQNALAKPANVVGIPSGTASTALNCVAKALHDSKLSDGALKAIVNGDEKYTPNATDKAAEAGMLTAVKACATAK